MALSQFDDARVRNAISPEGALIKDDLFLDMQFVGGSQQADQPVKKWNWFVLIATNYEIRDFRQYVWGRDQATG